MCNVVDIQKRAPTAWTPIQWTTKILPRYKIKYDWNYLSNNQRCAAIILDLYLRDIGDICGHSSSQLSVSLTMGEAVCSIQRRMRAWLFSLTWSFPSPSLSTKAGKTIDRKRAALQCESMSDEQCRDKRCYTWQQQSPEFKPQRQYRPPPSGMRLEHKNIYSTMIWGHH